MKYAVSGDSVYNVLLPTCHLTGPLEAYNNKKSNQCKFTPD